MKALVTGSSGFIGSHLAAALVERGFETHCLLRKASDTAFLQGLPLTFVHGDYAVPSTLRQAVTGMDLVFHLGGVINAGDWDTFYQANTLATEQLIDACAEANPNLKRFVFVSSISASGPSEAGVAKTEADPCNPVSMYGKSKLLAEEAVLGQQDRLPIVIIRPPNVLGTRQNDLRLSMNIIKRRIVPMVGDEHERTSICFVQDLVRALMLVAEQGQAIGRTYFVTDPKPYAWADIGLEISKALGVHPYVLKVPYSLLFGATSILESAVRLLGSEPPVSRDTLRSTRDFFWIYSSERIARECGFRTALSLEEGVRQIVGEYRQLGVL